MEKNKNISILELNSTSWYTVQDNTTAEMQVLKRIFKFNHDDLICCLPPMQRPKIVKYADYIFMILLYPYYDAKQKAIKTAEVDFFIGTDFIVTVHTEKLQALNEIIQKYSKKKSQKIENTQSSIDLIHEIIHELMADCFPMLNHIGLDIDHVEEQIFRNSGEKNIKEILLIKRNIINFRKAMQAHKVVIRKLNNHLEVLTGNNNRSLLFEGLIENTKDIWDLLDNYKETIEALNGSNESLGSLRMSEIMKMLTIISVITFPLTLFVTLFGTNMKSTPLINNPFGFWIVLTCTIFGALGMLYIFKHKKWF